MDIRVIIRSRKTGRVEEMPLRYWDLFQPKEDWEIVEPESQASPAPIKAIRAEEIMQAQADDTTGEVAVCDEPAPTKRGRKKRS